MATQALRNTFSIPTTIPQKSATKPLLRRVFDFIVEAQTRRAEKEIARFMGAHGLKFTDAVEREYEQRYLNSADKL